MQHSNYIAHATAVIDLGAIIGNSTTIWHFSHIMAGAVIGSNCIIGQNVFIDNNAVVGNGVKIQNNVSVYNSVTIQDHAFIGPSVVFTNVINPRSFINRKTEFKPTLVGTGATLGANSTILCGITIGNYALIAAGSVVVSNVLPFALIIGNKAVQTGWVSKAGHTLSFSSEGIATCKETGEKYLLSNNQVSCI